MLTFKLIVHQNPLRESGLLTDKHTDGHHVTFQYGYIFLPFELELQRRQIFQNYLDNIL